MPPPVLPHGRPQALCAALFTLFTLLANPLVAADLSGRWEGELRVPGTPLPIVLDLAAPAAGGWTAAVTLPGRGVKGASVGVQPLGAHGASVQLEAAFGGAGPAPTRLELQAQPDGSLAGTFHQGGHQATAALRRSGPAQVDHPRAGTAIDPSLAGTWTGRYELGGSPREVTLTLVQGASGVATGRLRIVGRRTTELALDRVIQTPQFLELEAGAAGIRIEGRWRTAPGRIEGTFGQGPFEAPLILQRRTPGGAP